MKNMAFVFPGQGSQYVGMGKEALENNERAREVFRVADEATGYPLSKLCFEGPEEELRLTYNTQPTVLTASVAILEWLKSEINLSPRFVAGHSLGEYAALVASNSMSFRDAVVAVRNRGIYMDEAVPAGIGAMAAVIGMDLDKLSEVCKEVTSDGHLVQLANQNSPGQIVISGTKEGVAIAGDKVLERGAKRFIPLNVSGPFHSSLMKPAAERLKDKLTELTISKATIPVVANTIAAAITEPRDIFNALVEQVASPVLWEDSVRYMVGQGIETFIEIGPGNVICNLIKKIDRNVRVISVQDLESLNKLKSECQ